MPLIVEDGTGITGANTYNTVSELNDYAAYDTAFDITSYTDAAKESALVISVRDYIDGLHDPRYEPITSTQGLKWPVKDDGLPIEIKKAALKAATLQLRGLLLVDQSTLSVSGSIESESKKLSVMSKSVTYKSGTSQRVYRVLPPELKALMQPFLSGGGFGTTRRA